MEYQNKVSFLVSGKRALFSDPLTRIGGEKYTYPIPTYQALKGVIESVYWKPTFTWFIDRVRIMNPIQTETQNVRPIQYNGGNTLSIYTYLQNPAYQIEAHFEWNQNRPELSNDRNENKHYFIAKRMIEKGGRRDVFLGTRECQAYVEPCPFHSGKGAYDDLSQMTFGLMVHGLNYPDESGKNQLEVRLWQPEMQNGVITFLRPEECRIIRSLGKMSAEKFIEGENFTVCDDLYQEEGGTP